MKVALEATEPTFSVLYLHGPGGVGKTFLLDAIERLAEDRAVPVRRVDGRVVAESRSSLTEALADLLDTAPNAADSAPVVGQVVVLVDAFERLAPMEDWIRVDLLPRLPASSVTVIAGRLPPSAEWRADNAWVDLLRVVSLRNFSPVECGEYLDAVGITGELADQVTRTTHGHPFALALLADIVLRGGGASFEPLSPDLVRALVDRFLDMAPTELHRRALGVCAIARVTTEGTLRDVVCGQDGRDLGAAAGLFAWLRGLSFVQADGEGLHPDDLAREVLDAELRWRDRDGYRSLVWGVWRHVRNQVGSEDVREQRHAIHDLKFLYRNLAGVRSPVEWGIWAAVQPEPEPATPVDHGPIVELVGRAEGPESAAMVSRWLQAQPGAFHVLRRPDREVRGVVGLLDLTAAAPGDVAADPGARAAWEHATRPGAPRAGEAVIELRVLVDADAYQDPSPTLNAAPVLQIQHFLRTPNLAWGFLTIAEPDKWNDYFAVADLHRVAGADFTVEGRTYGLFAHDFRTVPVDTWIDLVVERGLTGESNPGEVGPSGRLLVLSQVEFEHAVRQALHDLTSPDALARNPLVRTRLVQTRVTPAKNDAQALKGLLREAVDALRADPRDDRLWRAVDRTYARPASTQEAAAAMLGVPFSSYRRHLRQGVDRIVAQLWNQELHGEPATGWTARRPGERK